MEEETGNQINVFNENVDQSKRLRISFDLTKSFAYAQVSGSAEEKEKIAEVNQGLHFDGDVHIVNQIEGTKEILSIAYTEDFELVAAGFTDGSIRMFNIKTGEYISSLRDAEMIQYASSTTAIKHRPVKKSHPISQTLLASYCSGCVKSWHYPSGQCLYTIREKRQTLGLTYHPRLPKFVTVGDDTKLFMYDEESKTQERIFQASGAPEIMNGHQSRVFCACFHPTSNHELVSGGWDDTIQFWDVRQPFSLRHITGVHICGEGIDISSDGKEILTCSWQEKNALQLWDYSTGKLISTLEPGVYKSKFYCGKFINNMYFVCGGSDHNYIRIADHLKNSTVCGIKNLPGGVYSIDIGPSPAKRVKRSRQVETGSLPKIAFCSGKAIYEIELT